MSDELPQVQYIELRRRDPEQAVMHAVTKASQYQAELKALRNRLHALARTWDSREQRGCVAYWEDAGRELREILESSDG